MSQGTAYVTVEELMLVSNYLETLYALPNTVNEITFTVSTDLKVNFTRNNSESDWTAEVTAGRIVDRPGF